MNITYTPVKGNYDYITPFQKDRAMVCRERAISFIDRKSELLVPFFYRDSYQNENGEIVTCRTPFGSQEWIPVFDQKQRCGFVDYTGDTVIPFIYEKAAAFCNGFAAMQKNGKWGFIDKNNRIAVPFEYEDAGFFSEGLAAVRKNGKWGFVDQEGNVVIPFVYDCEIGRYICEFHEGLAPVGKDGEILYIDREGNEKIRVNYRFVGHFCDGFTIVCQLNDKAECLYGMLGKRGELLTPVDFSTMKLYREGLIAAEKDGRWRYLDNTGKEVLKTDYDIVSAFCQGMAWAKKNGKWGAIDKTGTVILPFEIDFDHIVIDAAEGLFCVRKGEKYGCIDRQGSSLVPFEFDLPISFHDGASVVKKEDQWGILELTL